MPAIVVQRAVRLRRELAGLTGIGALTLMDDIAPEQENRLPAASRFGGSPEICCSMRR